MSIQKNKQIRPNVLKMAFKMISCLLHFEPLKKRSLNRITLRAVMKSSNSMNILSYTKHCFIDIHLSIIIVIIIIVIIIITVQ